MHSGTFWNILHAFWNILEHSACILKHSPCMKTAWESPEDLSPIEKERALYTGQPNKQKLPEPKVILQAKMQIPPAGSRLRPSVGLDPPPPFTGQATATIGSCPHLCVKHKKCSLTKHLRSGRHIYLDQENTLLWRVWSQQQKLRYSSQWHFITIFSKLLI